MSRTKTIGIILAGGEGRRLGGVDKGLVNVQGRPLIEYVIEAIHPDIDDILIVANRHHDSYAAYGYPVVADDPSGFAGPMAGMLTGLRTTAEEYIQFQAIFVPVDAARLPNNYVDRLREASTSGLAVAQNADGLQPVCCLIASEHHDNFAHAFESGERSPSKWLQAQNAAISDFSHDPDCLWSINTPDELQAAEQAALPIKGAAA